MAELQPGHSDYVLKPHATDYIKGVNSPITFRAVSLGDWTPRIEFFENQDLQFETNGCAIFTPQESADAQIDNLIEIGDVPPALLAQFEAMGYMDTGLDVKPHFHSSERFLQVLTGNGFNGNSGPDAWDAMRKYGLLPWKDLPYDATTTEAEFLNPIPQPLLDKAKQFLDLIGGPDAIRYHWVLNGGTKNIQAMTGAMQQAPLCVGIAVNIPGWNQVTPTDPPATQPPQHSVMVYRISAANSNINILDHYAPYEKVLDANYPIAFALQGVVTIIAPVEQNIVQTASDLTKEVIAAPISAPEKFNLLALIANALKSLSVIFSPKVGSASPTMSQAFSISISELKKWGSNLLIFLAPVAAIYLMAVVVAVRADAAGLSFADFVPNAITIGAMALYVLNGALDFVRKFVPDTTQ